MASPTHASGHEETAEEREHRESIRTDGWIAVGAGSFAGAIALYTSGEMIGDLRVRSSNCNASKACSTSGYNANDELSSLGGWNLGAWVVAAAGWSIGAYLLVTHPKSPETKVVVGVVPIGPGAAFTIGGAF